MGLFDWMTVEQAKARDFEEAKYRLKKSRPVSRLQNFGEDESSVLMSSAGTEHGGGVAFPLLFPKEGQEFSSAPYDWDEYAQAGAAPAQGDPRGVVASHRKGSWVDALERAYAQDEAYEFRTEAEAENFAKGAWKEGHYFSSPSDEYLPDPSYLPSVASKGTKIPDNLWKAIMQLKKDLSLEGQKRLYYNFGAELLERGERQSPARYDEQYMKNRYNPEDNNQVGYVMDKKTMQKDLIGFYEGEPSGATGFYKDYKGKQDFRDGTYDKPLTGPYGKMPPDTIVVTPEEFYAPNLTEPRMAEESLNMPTNQYGFLGTYVHEDFHAGGVDKLASAGLNRGKLKRRASWGIGHPEGYASTTQRGYERLINSLFREKQRDIDLGPKNEKGEHQPGLLNETIEAMKNWLESENLDVGYDAVMVDAGDRDEKGNVIPFGPLYRSTKRLRDLEEER